MGDNLSNLQGKPILLLSCTVEAHGWGHHNLNHFHSSLSLYFQNAPEHLSIDLRGNIADLARKKI
jgi:hypothetical protein